MGAAFRGVHFVASRVSLDHGVVCPTGLECLTPGTASARPNNSRRHNADPPNAAH